MITVVRAACFALLAAAVLCGPASAFPAPNSPEKAKLPAPAGSGVVILSAGAPRKCIAMASELAIAPFDDQVHKRATAGVVVDSYAVKSDYPDHMGTLNVLILPAGEYQIYPGAVNPYVELFTARRHVFSVKAGETVYIGELFMTKGCSSRGVTFEMRDHEARDLALLRRRRPDLAAVTIVKRLVIENDNLAPMPDEKK